MLCDLGSPIPDQDAKNQSFMSSVRKEEIYQKCFKETFDFVRKYMSMFESTYKGPELTNSIYEFLYIQSHTENEEKWFYRLISYIFSASPYSYKLYFKQITNCIGQRFITYINQISTTSDFIPNPFLIQSYEFNTLSNAIENDDITQFSQIINELFNFDVSKEKAYFNQCFPVLCPVQSPCYESIIDISAYYGAIKIFFYCVLNDCSIDDKTCQFAVAGGKLEIINRIEANNKAFDNMLSISIMYNHPTITDYLMTNYHYEDVPLSICSCAFNYEAFLFFLLRSSPAINFNSFENKFYQESFLKMLEYLPPITMKENIVEFYLEKGLTIFDIMQNPLNKFAETHDMENLRLCIEHEENINKASLFKNSKYNILLTMTPLAALCSNPNTTLDDVKYLINSGAIVNKGLITPLYEICSHSSPNIDIIQYLLSNGADPKKGIANPLCPLCQNNNFEAVQLLIKHGADVNKVGLSSLSPLQYVLLQENINVQMLRLLLQNGADIRKVVYCRNVPQSMNRLMLSHITSNVQVMKLIAQYQTNLVETKEPRERIDSRLLLRAFETHDEDLINQALKNGNIFQMLAYAEEAEKTPEAIHNIMNFIESKYDAPANFIPSIVEAIQQNNIESVKFLLNHGVDVNLKYPYDFASTSYPLYEPISPIFLAFCLGNLSMLKLLINHEANVYETEESSVIDFLQLAGLIE